MNRTYVARELVVNDAGNQAFDITKIVEVSHFYILGNEKWLMALPAEGCMWEVTYDAEKWSYYLDRYTKTHNEAFRPLEIIREAMK